MTLTRVGGMCSSRGARGEGSPVQQDDAAVPQVCRAGKRWQGARCVWTTTCIAGLWGRVDGLRSRELQTTCGCSGDVRIVAGSGAQDLPCLQGGYAYLISKPVSKVCVSPVSFG